MNRCGQGGSGELARSDWMSRAIAQNDGDEETGCTGREMAASGIDEALPPLNACTLAGAAPGGQGA